MKEFELAVNAVKVAGDYLEANYSPVVDSQVGKDIKLSSDRKSEEMIVEILKDTGIPILSEEAGLINGKPDGFCWIVDPLDGSANYWKGLKELACTSVALWDGKEPILGAVYRFHTGELFSGIVDKGAWLNGESIHSSNITETRNAVLATGFPVKRDYSKESLSGFVRQVQSFKKSQNAWGSSTNGKYGC
jgi:myo-inositol-1(or 4)-monophosphatase